MFKIRLFNSLILSILLLFITISYSSVHAESEYRTQQRSIKPKQILLKDLHTEADVFNIEGGRPRKNLAKNKIWLNLAMVLDRPLLDGKTLDVITNENTYPLKEMSLEQYNETNVNLSLLLITNYYIENGRKLLKKSKTEPVNMVIQVHRDSSAPKMIAGISKLLTSCLNHSFSMSQDNSEDNLPILTIPEKNMTICFRKSAKYWGPYEDVDILFSVSLVGGLNPKLTAGSLTLPKEITPFDIITYQLRNIEKYSVENRLNKDLKAILAQPQKPYFEKLNTQFKTPNVNKKEIARELTIADFHTVKLLQIDDKFYPKNKEEPVIVY